MKFSARGYNGDAFQRVIYTESHDKVASKARVPEEIMPGEAHHWYPKKPATLGAALVLTAPGILMRFQGQAMLADGFSPMIGLLTGAAPMSSVTWYTCIATSLRYAAT